MKRSTICVAITLLVGIVQAQERPDRVADQNSQFSDGPPQARFYRQEQADAQSSVEDRQFSSNERVPQFPNIPAGTGNVDGRFGLSRSSASPNHVIYTYQHKRPVKYQVQAPNAPRGQMVERTKSVFAFAQATIDIDTPLETIELEGDAKRAAIQAITAARHPKLLQALKSASDEAEKAEAAKKLEENYRAHYAAETDRRLQSVDELKKRLQELETQLQERVASEDKYVQAAMTLANLHSQGILAEPPRLESRVSALPETDYYGAMPVTSQPMYPSVAPLFPPPRQSSPNAGGYSD